ncbi:MAG: hypothetical protein Q7U41_00885 [Microbacterium sp.]|nr:hypothetical protein [Microbacterium sp.]
MASTSRRALADPRLFIGIGLVVASVAGVVGIVSAAERTDGAYAAPALLLPGDRVTADDLRVVPVRLGSAVDGYIAQGELPDEGVVVTRVVAPGELVPIAAVGASEESDASAVVIPLRTPLPASMQPGRSVQIWAAPPAAAGVAGEPVLIADGAVLIGSATESDMIAGDGGSVEVLVPRERIPAVLDAVANAESIALVGAAGPAEPPAAAEDAQEDAEPDPTDDSGTPDGGESGSGKGGQ